MNRHILLLTALLPVFGSAFTYVPHTRLTQEERAWLDNNRDALVLWYNTDFPPIEFAAPDGTFIGLGADVIAALERRLDVSFIKRPSNDWNRHLAALESGECAIAPTIVPTAERERYAFFTPAYATVPVVIITTRAVQETLTIDDLAGRRVAVVSGYATEDYLRKEAQDRFDIVTVWNVSDGLRSLSFGQVDAFFENFAVAAYFIDKEGIPNLRVAGSTAYSFSWSIGVSRKYPLLYSAVRKALSDIDGHEMQAMRDRWISLAPYQGIDPEIQRLLLLTGLFTVLLLVCLALITVFLKRRLNEKVIVLKKAQEELRASEERYRVLISAIPDLVLRTTLDGRIVYVNDVDSPLLRARARSEVLGRNILDFVVPEDRNRALRMTRLMIKSKPGIYELRGRDANGDVRPCEVNGGILRDAAGRPIGMVYVVRDIATRKHAEEERERLRAQLIHAQKMESVGRLAGGVAHDFNNMLGVILGHTELARSKTSPDQPVFADINEIELAARRSADLTRQLLAFARKQTIAPKVLDLNAGVRNALQMLQRLIGEDIRLEWHPSDDLWKTRIDPAQFDQILTNLAVNARDAIEGAGRIVIETSNAAFDSRHCAQHEDCIPGEYVALTVSDCGKGMDPKTQAHIFEPFYTTKRDGQGTGLGLATVFGIVKQNNGFIHFDSEPGKGSTFRVYLPRCIAPDENPPPEPQTDIPRGNGETLLMIEDEPAIRNTAQTMLERLGYKVLAVGSSDAAIKLAERYATEIALLITDVVMPGMNGKELYERLRSVLPEIKCLFMSGYTADVIAHRGVLDERVHFIQKPFSIRELAVKVQEAIRLR